MSSAYRTTPNQILQLRDERRLVPEIDRYLRAAGHVPNPAEQRSWEKSLTELAKHLLRVGFGDIDMLVEYQLPRSSRRVDVILAGVQPGTGLDRYLVVELKQWSRAARYDDTQGLVQVSWTDEPQLHPRLQVAAYCEYLRDHVAALPEPRDALNGVVYLHNAELRNVADLDALERTWHSLLYTKDREGLFNDYLRKRFAPDGDRGAGNRLLTSAIRPSRQLLAHVAEELTGRRHFVLIDEQLRAYELVRRAITRAQQGRRKRVVIISGGAGSGKSAIALELLRNLAMEGRLVAHATGSKAFKESLQKYARRYPRQSGQRTRPLFNFFRDFMTAERDSLEVLICDEAHRLRERSDKGSGKNRVIGKIPQAAELIGTARTPVFLLDDHQVVRPGEVGRVELIRKIAKDMRYEVDLVRLGDQFRCGGSAAYERWLLNLLGLADGPVNPWPGDERFHVGVVGSPEEMETLLRRQQESSGETARITAGFCWEWTKQRRSDGSLAPDVRVGSWARPWNADRESTRDSAPASSFWAMELAGIGQIGCIYTAQGFEYEWAGVIIGPDLVFRDGQLVTQRSELKDGVFNKRPLTDAEVDPFIRNTYRVLLTRGLKGVLIYATDKETQRYLAGLVPSGFSRFPVVAAGVGRAGSAEQRPDQPVQPDHDDDRHRRISPADATGDGGR